MKIALILLLGGILLNPVHAGDDKIVQKFAGLFGKILDDGNDKKAQTDNETPPPSPTNATTTPTPQTTTSAPTDQSPQDMTLSQNDIDSLTQGGSTRSSSATNSGSDTSGYNSYSG